MNGQAKPAYVCARQNLRSLISYMLTNLQMDADIVRAQVEAILHELDFEKKARASE